MCREILERLDVESRMLKRAQYEAFSFEVEPGRVTVRNGSYAQPREHEYSVRVVDGVPTECTCPADEHRDDAGKHRLAVAIRSPVREAAAGAVVQADGGIDAGTEGEASSPASGVDDGANAVPDDCSCAEMPAGVPCWPCYRRGRKTFDD